MPDTLSEAELGLVQGGAAPQFSTRLQPNVTVTTTADRDTLELFRERMPVINPQRIRDIWADLHPDLEDPFPKEPPPKEPPIPPDLEDPFPPRPPTDLPFIR